jgi:hypothetical protein
VQAEQRACNVKLMRKIKMIRFRMLICLAEHAQ